MRFIFKHYTWWPLPVPWW